MANWYVGNNKFFDKRDFMLSVKSNPELEYGFWPDDSFNDYPENQSYKYDWKTLLKIKCQELRDNNKKLRLWYTGGADTHTILNAFINNDIHLDEIAIGYQFADIPGHENLHNKEQCLVAENYLKQNRNKLAQTKIRKIEFTTEMFEEYLDDFENGYASHHADTCGHLDFTPMRLLNWYYKLDNETCNITGDIKHCLDFDNTGYFTHVTDKTVQHIFDDLNVSCFYLDKRIWDKQNQMVLDYCNKAGLVDYAVSKNRSNFYRTTDKINRDPLPFEFSYGKHIDTIEFDFFRYAGITPEQPVEFLTWMGFTKLEANNIASFHVAKDIFVTQYIMQTHNEKFAEKYVNFFRKLDKFYKQNKFTDFMHDKHTITAGSVGISSPKFYLSYHTHSEKQRLMEYFKTENLDNVE